MCTNIHTEISVCIWMDKCVYTYTHTHGSIYIHIRTRLYIHIYIHICVYACVHTQTPLFLELMRSFQICICVHVYTCAYTYIYMCTFIYANPTFFEADHGSSNWSLSLSLSLFLSLFLSLSLDTNICLRTSKHVSMHYYTTHSFWSWSRVLKDPSVSILCRCAFTLSCVREGVVCVSYTKVSMIRFSSYPHKDSVGTRIYI